MINHLSEGRVALVRLRERVGLNQSELGKILGVRRQTISSWENGKSYPRLSLRGYILMMIHLDCSFEDLAKAIENPNIFEQLGR